MMIQISYKAKPACRLGELEIGEWFMCNEKVYVVDRAAKELGFMETICFHAQSSTAPSPYCVRLHKDMIVKKLSKVEVKLEVEV